MSETKEEVAKSLELPEGFHSFSPFPDGYWSYEVLYSDGTKAKGHYDDFEWPILNDDDAIRPLNAKHIVAIRPLSSDEVDSDGFPMSEDEELEYVSTDDDE